jgi:hypothetical protein
MKDLEEKAPYTSEYDDYEDEKKAKVIKVKQLIKCKIL